MGQPYYRSSILAGVIAVIVFIAIMIVIASASFSLDRNTKWTDVEQESTVQREKLYGVVNKTDWYEDNLHWITSPKVLTKGLESFYDETGIQPFILFVSYSDKYWNNNSLDSTEAKAYLEEYYNSNFTDEAHFIFAYFECKNDSKSEMDGEFLYLSGYSADTIMDSEAISILWGYFETNYYDTSLSIEEMIANTFSSTGQKIMDKATNGWDALKVFLIVVAVIVVVIVIYFIIKQVNKRKKEKEEHIEKVLEKPLDTFGTDTSDIEDKYK